VRAPTWGGLARREPSRNGTHGLVTLRSSSIQGLSVVTAIFRDGFDVFVARQLVGGKRPAQVPGLNDGWLLAGRVPKQRSPFARQLGTADPTRAGDVDSPASVLSRNSRPSPELR
jgi:hypothetical protein